MMSSDMNLYVVRENNYNNEILVSKSPHVGLLSNEFPKLKKVLDNKFDNHKIERYVGHPTEIPDHVKPIKILKKDNNADAD